MPRILRCLVCFFLICSLLVNLLPVRSEASATLAGSIAAVTSVNVPAGLVYGAAAIALGIGLGTNDDFMNMVSSAVSSAGDWVKDGTVELLQTIDETGQKAYYVAGDMLEDLRAHISSNVLDKVGYSTFSANIMGSSYNIEIANGKSVHRVVMGYRYPSGEITYTSYLVSSGLHFAYYYIDGGSRQMKSSLGVDGIYYTDWYSGPDLAKHGWKNVAAIIDIAGNSVTDAERFKGYSLSSLDLTLGSIPYAGTFTHGSSALTWIEEAAQRALYVIKGGNNPDPDSEPPNDGKWFWKLMIPTTVGLLYAASQYDEWTAETPAEFSDYTTSQEFEILDAPDFEGYPGIYVAPVTNPAPDPGTGTNPGTGGDSGETPEVNTDYSTWFSKIYTVVESIPGKLNEIPNIFQSWISDLKTSIQTQTDKLAEHAANTVASIQALPDAFAQSFADVKAAVLSVPNSIKEFFTPKPPSSHSQFALVDLKRFFPFCIPFDLYEFFKLLNAEPVAPVLSWEIKDLAGQTYSLDVDLAQWDSVALLFRRLQLFLFITGLAAASRKFIKW